MSFLFLLVAVPVLAKGSTEAQGQQGQAVVGSQGNTTVTTAPVKNTNTTITPTGNQVKNQNEVKTQNQGEDSQISVKTQESEQLNQDVDDSLTKVSDQVKELIETVGAKTGIGQEVKEIAQNQEKNQEKIKTSYGELKNRGSLVRLFVGSDKKLIQALEEMTEENKETIQKLEELKLETKNSSDLEQLQETIDLMIYQNTSLGEKISKEKQANGLFGWFVKLFDKE